MGSAVENEFKFTTDREIDGEAVVRELVSFLKMNNVDYSMKTKHSVDTYYDSGDLTLYMSDCILRLKNFPNGKMILTAKRPISIDNDMMSRKETERESDGSLEDVCAFASSEFPDIIVSPQPSLILECDRTSIAYGDGIDLTFDCCTYIFGERKKGFYEIELECMSDRTDTDFDRIRIRGFIKEHLGFEPVTKSKYRRGVEWSRAEIINVKLDFYDII